MPTEGRGAGPRQVPGGLYVAAVAALVAVLGTLVTGRPTFAAGVVLAAALAVGTMGVASRRGREAVAAGQHAKAGMLAGTLLAVRLLGLALLLVIAVMFPALLDMWGVLAGLVSADATLLVSEGTGMRLVV